MIPTKKPFEIPYNFDTRLIDFLNIYKSKIAIHSIYLPPFEEDYPYSAKRFTIKCYNQPMPNDRNDYEKHINYIKQYFPNTLMLLLQSNSHVLNTNQLQYYINLGFTQFCVGSIKQAKNIKKLFPEAEIIGSITMKIEPEELISKIKIYRKYFDGFVLWFPYNRDIPKIESLPKNFKYVLLVNCHCTTACDGTHHWFAQNLEYEKNYYLYCPRDSKEENRSFDKSIFIKPTHLYLFEDNISYFKLQGRELNTENLIRDIIMYTVDIDYYKVIEQHDIYQLYKIPYKRIKEDF